MNQTSFPKPNIHMVKKDIIWEMTQANDDIDIKNELTALELHGKKL